MIDPRKAGTVVPASNFQKKFAEKPTHTRFSRIQPHGHAHRCAPKRGRLRAPRWLSPARAPCALASLACRLTESPRAVYQTHSVQTGIAYGVPKGGVTNSLRSNRYRLRSPQGRCIKLTPFKQVSPAESPRAEVAPLAINAVLRCRSAFTASYAPLKAVSCRGFAAARRSCRLCSVGSG